jgi:hypothetical protein
MAGLTQMTAMEDAFCEYLLTKSSITDLIGTGDNARLWPDVLPEGYSVKSDGPAATYQIIDGTDEHTISDRCGFVQARVQISCFAWKRLIANQLARAIKNSGVIAMKGVSGGVDFRGVEVARGISTFDDSPTDGSQEHRYLADFDLMISYLE